MTNPVPINSRKQKPLAEVPARLMLPEIERALLAAVLARGNEAMEEGAKWVTPEDFSSENHRKVWYSVGRVRLAGKEPQLPAVYGDLAERGESGMDGSTWLLVEGLDGGVIGEVHRLWDVPTMVRILRQKTQARALYAAAETLANETSLTVESPDLLIRNAVDRLKEIDGLAYSEAQRQTIGSVFAGQNLRTALRPPRGTIHARFGGLQRMTMGFKPGEVALLAARPSMGKTAFALNLLIDAARRGHKSVLFSLEMAKDSIAKRLLSSMANVNLLDLMRGELTESEWIEVGCANKELQGLPLYAFDDAVKSTAHIRQQIERGRYEFAVIDYLGLIIEPGRYENRNAEVTVISRNVKAIARDLRIPVLALHQLNRAVEGRVDKRPELSDLRDSGAIEQDADLVMFLYREGYYKRNDPSLEHRAELLIRKQRNGPTGDIHLSFYRTFGIFEDVGE